MQTHNYQIFHQIFTLNNCEIALMRGLFRVRKNENESEKSFSFSSVKLWPNAQVSRRNKREKIDWDNKQSAGKSEKLLEILFLSRGFQSQTGCWRFYGISL